VRLPKIFRSAAFALSLAYAALFGASSAVLMAVVYWEVSDYSEDQLRDVIEAESEALVSEHREHGIDRLAETVRRWQENDQDRPASYLLLDASGRRIAGDLWSIEVHEGWFTFVAREDDGEEEPMLGLGVNLRGGGRLLVAEETEERDELIEALLSAFLLAGGISLALAVIGALLTSGAFLRRLEGFNRTADRIIDGALEERVPLRGTGDEFDRLASNLNAMLDRVQALVESMRQVSNDIAHDLRTPLSHLRQGLETVRRSEGDREQYREAIDRALAECDRILTTFGALLRIAQIEARTRRAGFTEVDLSSIFETIAETYAPVAEDHGKVLRAEIRPGIRMRGDPDLLTQMLANLVENAIRHTGTGSTIRISLEEDGQPIGTVVDDGPGIPEEARKRVFDRFFRLESSRATPGNGLGLSLVAAVAQLHEIEVELGEAQPGLHVALRF
jgi:signal transduction histidine kinase